MHWRWKPGSATPVYVPDDPAPAATPAASPFHKGSYGQPKPTGTPVLSQKQKDAAAKKALVAQKKEIANQKRIKAATIAAEKLAKEVLAKSRYAKMNVAAIGAAGQAKTALEAEYQKRVNAGAAHVKTTLGTLSNLSTKYIN